LLAMVEFILGFRRIRRQIDLRAPQILMRLFEPREHVGTAPSVRLHKAVCLPVQ
jgi:hypothetical protein